jgi:hypothetical protein
MTVEYLKIARTDLNAVCEISIEDPDHPQDLPITVHFTDSGGEAVFGAVITMYISEKNLNSN